MTLSDRICLMNGGKIEQLGSPGDLYFRPRTVFAADFLGESNLFEATVSSVSSDGAMLALDHGRVRALAVGNGASLQAGQQVRVLVRPQNLGLARELPASPHLSAQVLDVMITGSLTKLYLTAPFAGDTPITAAFPTSRDSEQFRRGETLALSWRDNDAVAIPADAVAP